MSITMIAWQTLCALPLLLDMLLLPVNMQCCVKSPAGLMHQKQGKWGKKHLLLVQTVVKK